MHQVDQIYSVAGGKGINAIELIVSAEHGYRAVIIVGFSLD
jgi:hypothetical protein